MATFKIVLATSLKIFEFSDIITLRNQHRNDPSIFRCLLTVCIKQEKRVPPISVPRIVD